MKYTESTVFFIWSLLCKVSSSVKCSAYSGKLQGVWKQNPWLMRLLLRTLMWEIIQFDILYHFHSVCMLILELCLCRVNPHCSWGHA